MRNGNVHLHLASPISALAVSPGIAIGPVRLYGALSHTPGKEQVAKIASSEVEAEEQRLREALQAAINELQELTRRVAQTRPSAVYACTSHARICAFIARCPLSCSV